MLYHYGLYLLSSGNYDLVEEVISLLDGDEAADLQWRFDEEAAGL